jgi:hypothetical protein
MTRDVIFSMPFTLLLVSALRAFQVLFIVHNTRISLKHSKLPPSCSGSKLVTSPVEMYTRTVHQNVFRLVIVVR